MVFVFLEDILMEKIYWSLLFVGLSLTLLTSIVIGQPLRQIIDAGQRTVSIPEKIDRIFSLPFLMPHLLRISPI